jgi:hypothetical protein
MLLDIVNSMKIVAIGEWVARRMERPPPPARRRSKSKRIRTVLRDDAQSLHALVVAHDVREAVRTVPASAT